jgi:hypothetical protein
MKEQLNRVGWISDVVAVDPIELLVYCWKLARRRAAGASIANDEHLAMLK